VVIKILCGENPHKPILNLGITGRLRVGREGFNSTLTGPNKESVRQFCQFLREFMPQTFGETDFKIVDHQPQNHLLKGLKVWPVTEIVTYGFDPKDAPLDMRGTHLPPEEFHEKMTAQNSIMIDVSPHETNASLSTPPTL
jgi:predicted sulfurtransferase